MKDRKDKAESCPCSTLTLMSLQTGKDPQGMKQYIVFTVSKNTFLLLAEEMY